jgi:hypothetical protein
MFVCYARQNDVFFSAASCKEDIIFASMTNKYLALLILLGLCTTFFQNNAPFTNLEINQ